MTGKKKRLFDLNFRRDTNIEDLAEYLNVIAEHIANHEPIPADFSHGLSGAFREAARHLKNGAEDIAGRSLLKSLGFKESRHINKYVGKAGVDARFLDYEFPRDFKKRGSKQAFIRKYAKKFDVSEKTIQRDLEELAAMIKEMLADED